MSGWSDVSKCPYCGAKMYISGETRPYDQVYGECLSCGFCYYTKDGQMKLKEVNERRKELDLRPLKKLKKQIGR